MKLIHIIYSIKGFFNRITGKVAPTLYIEETEQHFEKLFDIKEGEHTVYHELASEYVHVDIHIVKPNENRPFYLLFTTGMSDLPMTVPEDASWDFKKINERAELFCLLPADWKFGNYSSKEEEKRYMWIISCLKTAARYPHQCGTWLASAHTLQYTERNEYFADNTELSSAIFIQLNKEDFGGKYGDEIGFFRTSDDNYINMLCFIPLYEDEMNFKLEKGGDALFMRLFGPAVTDFSQLVTVTDRENVCFNKSV